MKFTSSNPLRRGLDLLLPLSIASLLVVSLGKLGLLSPLVQAEQELRFRLRGQRSWADQVTVIAIDDPSLVALGSFPWPRRRYAELLQQLETAPPQVIVFDLLFTDVSPDDNALAAAIAAHSAVILASSWDRQGNPLSPTPTLATVALASGHIWQPRQGGFPYSIEPMVGSQPALAIAAAEALSLTQQAVTLPPLDRRLGVNWPAAAARLPTYSFVDVLEGRVPPQAFEGKVVLIGATALGLDDWVTPFDIDPPTSGVYLHGALIDNILHRRWLRPVPLAWGGAGVLALALAIGLRWHFWGRSLGESLPQQIGLVGGCLIAWWALALGLLTTNFWLPVVGPGLLLGTVGGLSISQQSLRQNRWLLHLALALQHRHGSTLLPDETRPIAADDARLRRDRGSGVAQLVGLTEQLGRSQAIQAAIARSLPLGLVAAAHDGTVWFVNPLAAEWLNLTAGDMLTTSALSAWFEIGAWEQIWATVTQGQTVPTQLRQQQQQWYEIRLEPITTEVSMAIDWPRGAIVLIEDITYRQRMEAQLRQLNTSLEEKVQQRTHQLEQLNQSLQEQIIERHLAQNQLAYEALHDPLTGLPNRRQFLKHLSNLFRQSKGELFAVLFLDCDRFKLINDSFGHWVGDELLKQVAAILQECIRPTDVVARFGGDEFTILLSTLDQVNDAIAVAQRIRQRFTQALTIQDHQLFTNTSIGIVIGGPHYNHPDEILRDADTAMYQAKMNRAGYMLFEADMHLDVRRSLQIETALRMALERQEFQIHYQPIVNLKTRQIIGCEALLRWLHPDRGLLLPGDFIPIAENTGLMIAIGSWVLTKACVQMQRWRRRNLLPSDAMVSVNLSATQFLQPDFIAQVDRTLAESDLPASNLKLEITETVVIQNPEQVVPMLQSLRDRGIRLSIDDFGTGYSSLGYLQQLPFDILKIDRSFIINIHHSPKQYGIVETIIRLAAHLDIQVIAEGIELFPQLESLNQLGCEFGQGFFFSRPLSVSQFSQYLGNQDSSATT
ncbi:EAL domain-containing protein [Nodosilinea sp. LEGE 07088]|uniref:EAL domain-containing protein n=1 Tax=Nodosilinea sp. LEGE 07088 TaxID=2777968 RepID=UPI00188282ED|nr:EAL domain-containing protein [Nodosilinea sp. LEGE 07088]MBE9136215.1 EAL domain-containing protein [Nodosilinea sp. LEGE 07088]